MAFDSNLFSKTLQGQEKRVDPIKKPQAPNLKPTFDKLDGSGSQGGTNTNNDTNTTPTFNNQSELNNYLYDSGLQNIFKDYKENIEMLDQSEQDNLQEAYFIREMSKKYLGEYASNKNIGDVSGNLLDIYGKYQENSSNIKANFDALELNLNQEYRKEKMGMFEAKMQEQFNMELADFNEGSREIMFNAVTGKYGDDYANGFEYLQSEYDAGNMNQIDFQQAYASLSSSTFEAIKTNLENQNYEGLGSAEEYINSFDFLDDNQRSVLNGVVSQVDEQNQRTDVINNLNTRDYGEGVNGMEYLEQNRDLIGEDAYQQLYPKVYAEVYENAFDVEENFDPETMTVEEYVKQQSELGLSSTDADELRSGLTEYVEQYEASKIDTSVADEMGDDYDFNATFGSENVGSDSYIYRDSSGILHATVKNSSEQEGQDGWNASHDDINEAYGDTPQTGSQIEFTALRTNEEDVTETKDFTYTYMDGQWYRTVSENPVSDVEMKQWSYEADEDGADTVEGDNFTLDDNYDNKKLILDKWRKDKNGPDTFNYKGEKYVQEDSVYAGESRQELQKIKRKFNDVHGDNDNDNVVVLVDNTFYLRQNGKIYKMAKEE